MLDQFFLKYERGVKWTPPPPPPPGKTKIELQMLLKSPLLHKDIVLPRHAIFCIFVSMSTSRSIYVLFM